jgi:hypothetical protein
MSPAFVEPKANADAGQSYASLNGRIEFSCDFKYKIGNRSSTCKRLNSICALPDEKASNRSPDRRISKSTDKVNCLASEPPPCWNRLPASLTFRRHGNPFGCTIFGSTSSRHQVTITGPPTPSTKFNSLKLFDADLRHYPVMGSGLL